MGSTTHETGVYSNREIRAAIKAGEIILHPYTPEHVNGSSVDLTLGEWYYRTDRATGRDIYNPFDEDDVIRYFGEARQAKRHDELMESLGRTMLVNIPSDHPVIYLEAGERILAHTHEFVGIKPPGTTSMQARSTWGRNGVGVCMDAGWGDPGYVNRWTMEIINLNRRHGIVLPVGERVAQMVFYHTGPVDGEYADLSGKYQGTSGEDLATLIAAWKPELMLPRAYKDERQLPTPLHD